MCREFGRLPRQVEELPAAEFIELVAFLKICDDEEREALKRAEAEAESKAKHKRSR